MSVPVITFFNNKGGVGKTTLVYHLAWMLSELQHRVLAADLDPQANLTSAFLSEETQESLFEDHAAGETIFDCIQPLFKGTGDIHAAKVVKINDRLKLIPGDLRLSAFEDQLSAAWPDCSDGDERGFRVMSAFWRVLQSTAKEMTASHILVDLGPNLGAINRSALIGTDLVVIPLAPDLFSLQGLRNLGPRLREWRTQWLERRSRSSVKDLPLPIGQMRPAGYIVLQHSVRLDRPVKAYERWIRRIPSEYQEALLQNSASGPATVEQDTNCLALLKNYRSLIPMAQEARKPIFLLKSADGALGSHENAAKAAYGDFKALADAIMNRVEELSVTRAQVTTS